jgi:hypothetical protein
MSDDERTEIEEWATLERRLMVLDYQSSAFGSQR